MKKKIAKKIAKKKLPKGAKSFKFSKKKKQKED